MFMRCFIAITRHAAVFAITADTVRLRRLLIIAFATRRHAFA